MKSVKFIDQLKEKEGLKNDLAAAKFLNWTSGKMSQYRTGARVMDDEACLALALALEIDPLQIVGAACIDRAEKSGQSSLWEVFMSRTAATAASAVLAIGVNLILTPQNAEARTYSQSSHQESSCIYIM